MNFIANSPVADWNSYHIYLHLRKAVFCDRTNAEFLPWCWFLFYVYWVLCWHILEEINAISIYFCVSDNTSSFILLRMFSSSYAAITRWMWELNVAWMWKSSARCLNFARDAQNSATILSNHRTNAGFVWTIRVDLIHIWMKITRICEISAVERWLLTSIFSCQIQRV